MKKKFLFHTILYTIAPKLPAAAGFLVLPFISPYITLNDYGKFGLVVACYSLFSLTVTVGQRVILQNSFFEYAEKYNRVWRRCYGIMTIGSIIGSVLMAIVLFFLLNKTIDREYIIITGLCAVSLIASPIDSLAQVYFTLKQRPFAMAFRALILSLLNVTILLITIKYLKIGYIGLIIGFASSSVFSLLFYLYPICIKQKIYPLLFFKKKHFYEYIKVGLPLLPHYLSLSIFSTSDRMLLGFYKINITSIGLYSQGYGIGSNAMVFLNGIFSAIARTLQVSFRNKTAEDKRSLRIIFTMLMAGIGLIFFNISLWMKEVYMFLFRKAELQTGYPVAILVLMAHIFFPLYSFGVYSLFITKNTKAIAKITFMAALVNVVLNLIFIPIYNIWASLLTTSFSFIFLSVMVLFIKEAKEHLSWLFKNVSFVYAFFILYGISLTLLIWYLKDINWMIKIFISLSSLLIAGITYLNRKKFFSKRHTIIRVVNERFKSIQ